jgi:uncharacterized protein involved in exopolysaccharide biosynthesis/Mrp family chromosome partitioning ATPase
MNSPETAIPALPAPAASMSANDIFYVLFRHKWKISICTLLGLGTAAGLFFFQPQPYQSDAMLFIRYVTENSAPGLPSGSDSKSITPGGGDTILNTEVDILSSLDIDDQVADTVGPDKILTKVKDPKERDRDHAALAVRRGLIIEALPYTSVIHLTFKDYDPAVVQPVLEAVIEAYYKKHLEVHREAGAIGDFLSQETDQLRTRLSQTEDELRKEKDKAGIISLADSEKSFSDQESRLQEGIYNATAEFAERSARYDELVKHAPTAPKTVATNSGPAVAPVPSAQIDSYRNLLIRLDGLQKSEQQLLTQFTDQNQEVKNVRAQIADVEKQKQAIEDQYPRLAQFGMPVQSSPGSVAMAPGSPTGAADLQTEAAYLTGLQSKIKVLTAQLASVKTAAANVDGVEGNIAELQRQRDLEEANYKYFSEHLEASRIDEQLTAGRALNIAAIQSPTPPHPDLQKFYKSLGYIASSGLGVGLAWAFLIEFYLDRSIRRPQDIERGLRIPLFLSIPDFGRNGHNREVFHETLRDRLIAYFESRGLTHKPKLVAITGVSAKAGVTMTATGLARSLSETGEGNVLLVDMTQSQGSAQQFNKGKPVCGIDHLLETRNDAQVQDNLFVVGADEKSEKLSRALPHRFNSLVPKLKASDFDYIIFDMPAVNQISITPRLAQFMDMVLLVVESEHTDRDIAKQAAVLLGDSHAHVGAILNKTRNYVPSRAHHEFLGSA